MPLDVADQVSIIQGIQYRVDRAAGRVKDARLFYTMLMILITLFVLFVATWIALFLAQPDQRADHRPAATPPARCARAI